MTRCPVCARGVHVVTLEGELGASRCPHAGCSARLVGWRDDGEIAVATPEAYLARRTAPAFVQLADRRDAGTLALYVMASAGLLVAASFALRSVATLRLRPIVREVFCVPPAMLLVAALTCAGIILFDLTLPRRRERRAVREAPSTLRLAREPATYRA